MKKITLILVAFLLIISCKNNSEISSNEIKKSCNANSITKEQLANILYSKDLTGVQFIDIRTPHDYTISHLPNAINIPMKNFFNKKYFKKINKNDVLIVYGADATSPRLMALMSDHFNKGNFYIALGGYTYIRHNIIDNYAIYSGMYDDEKPLVDFQKTIDEIKSKAGVKSDKIIKKTTSSKPIVKRKKKEVTGGCG